MVYFIENKLTKQWLYIKWEPKYINTFNGSRLKGHSVPHPAWTNDPNEAMQLKKNESADIWIRMFDLGDTVEVTEHEFISPLGEQ